MITIAQVLAVLVGVGIVGSALEKAGYAFNLPRLTAAGKVMEGIASDGPKVVANIIAAFKGSPVK